MLSNFSSLYGDMGVVIYLYLILVFGYEKSYFVFCFDI